MLFITIGTFSVIISIFFLCLSCLFFWTPIIHWYSWYRAGTVKRLLIFFLSLTEFINAIVCFQVHSFPLPSQSPLGVFLLDYCLLHNKISNWASLIGCNYLYLLCSHFHHILLLFSKYECLKFFEHIYDSYLEVFSAKSNGWSYSEKRSFWLLVNYYESHFLIFFLSYYIIVSIRKNIRSTLSKFLSI